MGKVLAETHERDLQVGKHMRPCGSAHLPAPAILQYSQAHQHCRHCGHGYPSEKTFSGLRSIHSVSTWEIAGIAQTTVRAESRLFDYMSVVTLPLPSALHAS